MDSGHEYRLLPTIIITMNNNRKIRTSRWIRKRELLFFMMLPVWLMGLRSLWISCFLPLHSKILKLWGTNGSLWLTQYLAQVSRAIVLWMGGERLVQRGPTVGVAMTRGGLPLILPKALRSIFYLIKGEDSFYALKVIKVTLTILSVYRVIGCAPLLKIETITGPFSGKCTTLPFWEVSSVIALLPRVLKLAPVSWELLTESAGPNSKRATWSCGLDALAFLRDPLMCFRWFSIASAQGAWTLILWFILTVVSSIVVVPVLVGWGLFPKYLGRLVKLFEARGKVRVVAITDWWTQVLLRPLHDACFTILKSIPQDGTFDQMQPIHRLMAYVRVSGAKVYSFDLSAATDRLPILCQVQILEALGVSWAKHWAHLLVGRPWYLGSRGLFYAVGQPMGALSSWAMLALCHHILVQIAARRAGYTEWFVHYALLGDDVVIADSGVAGCYHTLMSDLGVQINSSKSFELSSGLLEFAKRWVHPHLGDLSPMGAGLILACIRNPRLIVVLIQDALKRDFVFSTRVVRDLNGFLRKIRPSRWLGLWLKAIISSVTGPDGGLWDSASGPLFKASWIMMFPHHLRNKFSSIVDLYYSTVAETFETPLSEESQMEQLVSRFWDQVDLFRGSLWGVISMPLVLCSPAFWVYYTLASRAEERLAEFNAAKRSLFVRLLSSWHYDGLDLVGRKVSFQRFLRVNFDPDLLNWDRKAVDAILTRHQNFPALWESYYQGRIELEEAMYKSMPVVVDPYADFDFDEDE
jgi:hypothetical protein